MKDMDNDITSVEQLLYGVENSIKQATFLIVVYKYTNSIWAVVSGVGGEAAWNRG